MCDMAHEDDLVFTLVRRSRTQLINISTIYFFYLQYKSTVFVPHLYLICTVFVPYLQRYHASLVFTLGSMRNTNQRATLSLIQLFLFDLQRM